MATSAPRLDVLEKFTHTPLYSACQEVNWGRSSFHIASYCPPVLAPVRPGTLLATMFWITCV